MKKAIIWFWMLGKRLYTKALLWILLLLIPVTVLGLQQAVREDSGIVTVVLVQEDASDPLAWTIRQMLTEQSELIRFIEADSISQAEALVTAGKADSAWILPEDLNGRISAFLQDPLSHPVAQVLQRQDNVLLRLAREKLSGALFHCCSQPLYLQFIRENTPQLAQLSDEALLEYFRHIGTDQPLFSFSTLGSSPPASQPEYLLSPIRGLLGILLTVCSLASALYFLQDRRNGTFGWITQCRMPLVELGGQLAALLPLSAVSLLSLTLCGQTVSLGQELAVTLLYILCTASFGMLMRRLCIGSRTLSLMLCILVLAMLVICPVFLDTEPLRPLQLLFPPTYYIQAPYSSTYLLYMPVYTATCLLACLLLEKISFIKR